VLKSNDKDERREKLPQITQNKTSKFRDPC
jgi:hypothetical protein